jgi:deoxyribodipyrimidine photolyase-related protein
MEVLLFPNQLFEPSVLRNIIKRPISKIHFIEDPLYYGKRNSSDAVKKLKLNQLRIVYMRVVHKHYIKLLESYFTVEYHKIENLTTFSYNSLNPNSLYIDPCDIILEKKLSKFTKLSSPSFLMTRDELIMYANERKNKQLQHVHFYKVVKDKLNILQNVKSMDKENRIPFSKNVPIPKTAYNTVFTSSNEWYDAIEWISTTEFSKNPKPINWDIDYLTQLPITSKDVSIWMDQFFKERFINYGKYQDIIYDKNPLFYHSGLSIYLNNGLILPNTVVETATKYKKDIQSYEGFVRQIIGWREYARYFYYHVPARIYKQNVFNNTKKKLGKEWYRGNVGIPIIDKNIVYAMNYGYLNHIQRLMVISNYMILAGYHPDMIYKWMFEFSLDSYEWVMVFNCYSMGSYSDNGHAMRKPYISSSNYIFRMSNENKGEWSDKWDALYRAFIKKQKDILKHTQLANLVKNV